MNETIITTDAGDRVIVGDWQSDGTLYLGIAEVLALCDCRLTRDQVIELISHLSNRIYPIGPIKRID